MYKLVRKLVGAGVAAATSLNRRLGSTGSPVCLSGVADRVGEGCINAASFRAAALAGAWAMKEQEEGDAAPLWAAALAGAWLAEEQEAGDGGAIAAGGR